MESDGNPILLNAVTKKSRQLQERPGRDEKKQSKDNLYSRVKSSAQGEGM